MKLILVREIAVIALAASPFIAQMPLLCDPARSASYAGDGNTQFGNGGVDAVNRGSSGKLQFNTTYRAEAETSAQRTNCKWKVYTVGIQDHVTVVQGKGDYLTAKIYVEEPSRVQVFLRSENCGLWKKK